MDSGNRRDGVRRSVARFDPAAAWEALPLMMQTRIGIAGCVLAHAEATKIHGMAVPAGAYATAFAEAVDALRVEALLHPAIFAGGFPDLGPLGIGQCRECGCTQRFACEGGCRWVESDLCSACLMRAAAPLAPEAAP